MTRRKVPMFRRHTDVTAVSPEAVEHVTSICHIWKLQTFDLFYLELKLRFPITAEMLTDIRNLIRKRFVDAEQPFDIELLRVSRHCDVTALHYHSVHMLWRHCRRIATHIDGNLCSSTWRHQRNSCTQCGTILCTVCSRLETIATSFRFSSTSSLRSPSTRSKATRKWETWNRRKEGNWWSLSLVYEKDSTTFDSRKHAFVFVFNVVFANVFALAVHLCEILTHFCLMCVKRFCKL